MHSHRTTRALAALTLGLALTVTAAACGSDNNSDASSQVSTTGHNDADVAFATDMIQHHAQALSMVDLTVGRPLDPEVTKLAEAIREAQAPEIETMVDWLTEWDEKIPATMRDHTNAGHDMNDMDMGDSMGGTDDGMPGMMSADDMTALQDAPDAAFQNMWLEMMVKHHEGAVEMAKAEQTDGQYKPAVDLAEGIISSQTEEIDTMSALHD